MFDFIKTIKTETLPHVVGDLEEVKTVRGSTSSKRSLRQKHKTIKKERINLAIQKLKCEIEGKLQRAEEKFSALILEESSPEQSEGKDSVDDWKEHLPEIKLPKLQELVRPSQMAPRKYTMARRKPNELTDEELP